MTSGVSYTWLIEHLATLKPEQIQDWIANITYVPRSHVPIEICDDKFAYHWYRYLTRVANQLRKRPDEDSAKLIFEMFADEPDSESRCEIMRRAHRHQHMKLFPNCSRAERTIVQRTSREAKIGKLGANDVHDVRLTAYKHVKAKQNTPEPNLVKGVFNSEAPDG